MHANEKVYCPKCGEMTFAKLEPVLQGFTRIGDRLVCPLCRTVLGEPGDPGSEAARAAGSVDKLAALLSTETITKPALSVSAADRRFCKDCAEYVAHPFGGRCGRSGKGVEPMEDCAQFRAKVAAPAAEDRP